MVRVLFLHPDLGIGGAERLVVDAALALKQRGHDVSFLTNHHDRTHCFSETADGTLRVRVVGDWLPRKFFGRFYAFCAYVRMLYAAVYAAFVLPRQRDEQRFDVIFCDQISVGIPLLRLSSVAGPRPRIIFYCHFPDQLMSDASGGALKRWYRAPLNYLEELTVGMADVTLVNSKFTLRVFRDTFRRLERLMPDVLYPSLNTRYFDEMQRKVPPPPLPLSFVDTPMSNAFIFLDINRYDRKKNHALALRAFELCKHELTAADWSRCRLVIAGGYDKQNVENIEHYDELDTLTKELRLDENVVLLRSPSDDEKFALLNRAQCLVYTPANEHFGIVPLEGMYMSRPVIGVNSGGPTETIVHNSTGYLCAPDANVFAAAMLQLFRDEGLRERMGAMGRTRVEQKFSFEAFANKLDNIVAEVMKNADVKKVN